MISNSQYQEWLRDDSALRCLLVEVTPNFLGVDKPIYLASTAFITKPGDVLANTEYLDIIQGGVKITERASVDGSVSMSYGDIELENNEGTYDSWLDGVWVNRQATILFGDVRWQRSDFRVVFRGIIADIDSSSRNRLNLKLRDRLQLLNTPITETKLGGETDNKDRLLPVLMGEVHNLEPLLVDPPNHEYQFHKGLSERIIEVRDNGVPVQYVTTLSAGTFMLTASPKGQITVSAQGDSNGGYSNTIPGIIKKLIKNYGRAGNRFTDQDIDLTNFSEFEATHPAAVGTYLGDKANVLETCQSLAASLGAMLTTARSGLLQILQVNPAVGRSDAVVVDDDDIALNSLKIVERTEVSGAVKLGYCQNWTVQTKLESGIPEAHQNLFALDWLTTTQQDQATVDLYRLHSVPEQEDTALLSEEDAIAEARRRLNIRKVPRTTFQYTGYTDSLDLKLGGEIFLRNDRFGLSAGKYGVIVGLEPDWLNRRCTVKVII